MQGWFTLLSVLLCRRMVGMNTGEFEKQTTFTLKGFSSQAAAELRCRGPGKSSQAGDFAMCKDGEEGE